MSLESIDELDHVIFVYRRNGRWGSVARSRDPGLHGRKAMFATPRALAKSYLDEYVDLTGQVTGFTVFDLRCLSPYDWRLAERNVWKVERTLIDAPHQPLRMPEARFQSFRKRYRAFKEQHPDRQPILYEGRDRWTDIPKEFLRTRTARPRLAPAAGTNRGRNRGWAW